MNFHPRRFWGKSFPFEIYYRIDKLSEGKLIENPAENGGEILMNLMIFMAH